MNIQKWEQTRAKGRNRFLWVYGVGVFGVLEGLVLIVLFELLDKNNDLLASIVIFSIVFPVTGYFQAKYMWKKSEEKYQKIKATEHEK